jgi:hypothetical protein
MIFTIKGEIVKQQTQEDFVQVGWCLAHDNNPHLDKTWKISKKKYADKFVDNYNHWNGEKINSYHLMEIFVKKEDENE